MLSRTADSLYWMARYIERAENVARLLDVSYRMSLLPVEDAAGYWGAVLGISGLEHAYRARHGAITATNVLRFMVLDNGTPSSILASLRAARENAHAVRGTITSEMWETINTTWLEARETQPATLQGSGLTRFLEWVKMQSHLSRGVTLGTMLQDEPFHFVRLGTFLERADNTARILDFKFDELAPRSQPGREYYEWGALLRSVSAFELYRKVFRDVITPARVAELLILRADMPRSLHACMHMVHDTLRTLRNDQSAETERRAGELFAALHYGRMEDIFRDGLHTYLTHFLERVADIGNRISQDFLVPA